MKYFSLKRGCDTQLSLAKRGRSSGEQVTMCSEQKHKDIFLLFRITIQDVRQKTGDVTTDP